MPSLQILVPSVYLTIATIGLVGNGIVLYVMFFIVKGKSVTEVYITNLAISDILLLSSLPFWAAEQIMRDWVFGDVLCKILSGFTYINMYASIFFLTAMGMDRWLAVVQAVESRKRRTLKRAWISSAIIWAVSLAFTILPVIFRSSMRHGSRRYCKWNFPRGEIGLRLNIVYYASRTIIGFIIPLCVILFCYIGIVRFMKKRNRSKSHRLKDKVTRMVTVIIACFVISWLPNQVTNTIHLFNMSGLVDYGCGTTKQSQSTVKEVDPMNGNITTSMPTYLDATTTYYDKVTSTHDPQPKNIFLTAKEMEDPLNEFGSGQYGETAEINFVFMNASESTTAATTKPVYRPCATLITIQYIHLITACLALSNSTMNPFIYAFVGSTFKKHISNMRNTLSRRKSRISISTRTSMVVSIIRRKRNVPSRSSPVQGSTQNAPVFSENTNGDYGDGLKSADINRKDSTSEHDSTLLLTRYQSSSLAQPLVRRNDAEDQKTYKVKLLNNSRAEYEEKNLLAESNEAQDESNCNYVMLRGRTEYV